MEEPHQILIVDDEPDLEPLILRRMRRKIRSGQYSFLSAQNGVQALEVLNEYPHIDIVISDINMPEMDGLTLRTDTESRSQHSGHHRIRVRRHEEYPHRDEEGRGGFHHQAGRF